MKPSRKSTESGAIAELYNRTLQAYNRAPAEGELDAWGNVLHFASESDVDAALRRWQGDTTIEEYTGRPRGARMPNAAELKVSIERFNRAGSEHFIACENCEEGWVRVFEGQTAGWWNGTRREKSKVDPVIGAVKRCDCFLEWKERARIGAKR